MRSWMVSPGHGTAPRSRVHWLERVYELIFVACVSQLADLLGAEPGLDSALVVVGWLLGLWVVRLMLAMALNRFPDEGAVTRIIVIAQMLALTVMVSTATSVAMTDNAMGTIATAFLNLTVAAMYWAIGRNHSEVREVVRTPALASLVVAIVVLVTTPFPGALSSGLRGLAFLGLVLAFFLIYLPRVEKVRPTNAEHVAADHGDLFLVLLGLSFVKVAFATSAGGSVNLWVVVGALAVGVALWTVYVDGVVPYGFPTSYPAASRWLGAQLLLATGITVAASAVVVVPPTSDGVVSSSGAILGGGSMAVVFLALAVVAATSPHSPPRLALLRLAVGLTIVIITALVVAWGQATDPSFDLAVGLFAIAGAVVDALVRRAAGPRREERIGP